MVKMPELEEVTDPAQRADLARWVVSLRRAYAAETGQATSKLHVCDAHADSYCCLGIWCVVQTAAGVLERDDLDDVRRYGRVGGKLDGDLRIWSDGALPDAAKLANATDPDLLRFVDRDRVDDDVDTAVAVYVEEFGATAEDWAEHNASSVSASELNDDHGLNFAQIADVVAWRYQLTARELIVAEFSPRVPEVEGPAS